LGSGGSEAAVPEGSVVSAGFHEQSDGTLVCRHRDLSACPACAEHPQVVEVVGAHFWDEDGSLATALLEVQS
jgi:hypothetical protein